MVPPHIHHPQVVKSHNANIGFVIKAKCKNPHTQFTEKLRDGRWGSSGNWLTHVLWISLFFVATLTWEMQPTLKDFQMNVTAGLQAAVFWRIVHRCKNMILTLQNSNIQNQCSKRKSTSELNHLPGHSSSQRCAYSSTKLWPHTRHWMFSTYCVVLRLPAGRNVFLSTDFKTIPFLDAFCWFFHFLATI